MFECFIINVGVMGLGVKAKTICPPATLNALEPDKNIRPVKHHCSFTRKLIYTPGKYDHTGG